MDARKIKHRFNYFLKRDFVDTKETSWETTINVPFDVHDVRVRQIINADEPLSRKADSKDADAVKTMVVFYATNIWTVNMEGVGDIGLIAGDTKSEPLSTFAINGPVKGSKRFSLRTLEGVKVSDGAHMGMLAVHLEFLQYE